MRPTYGPLTVRLLLFLLSLHLTLPHLTSPHGLSSASASVSSFATFIYYFYLVLQGTVLKHTNSFEFNLRATSTLIDSLTISNFTVNGSAISLRMDTIQYYLFDFWEVEGDPRISQYPFFHGGPWKAWSIIAFYVYFVKSLGPALMKNREALNLRPLILAYNLLMILVNSYFFYEIVVTYRFGVDMNMYNFERPDPNDHSPKTMHIVRLCFLFLLSKYADLIETVFFVLRKKNNQISTLHTYHHSVTPFLIWMAVKLMPCAGPAGLFPLCNSFIHAIMYSYYALSALGPTYRRLLFWKKYITLLQLAQFVVYIIHATLFLFLQSGYPKFIVYVAYVQNPFFFIMFYQFFHTTYGTIKQSSGTLISKPQLKTS